MDRQRGAFGRGDDLVYRQLKGADRDGRLAFNQIIKDSARNDDPKKKKQQFIQPGTSCEPFEEHLSTTVLTENGVTTYLIAKALKGPMLRLATEF